jgi:hypothetical protein
MSAAVGKSLHIGEHDRSTLTKAYKLLLLTGIFSFRRLRFF